ncbi:MAG: ATP-binding cassette domain-containing protein [Ignavibacteriaceae bacterium]|jgi:ABC-type multidrug transport system ATPase subunit|nr:ATP-binding cassette domain-containing protein [Ignavibacteriaceae bacterium]
MQKLEANNVFYKKENQILSDFSFSFDEHLYGILSDQQEENSNVLKVLAGLREPDQGNILLDGKNVYTTFQKKERAIRKQIGFVFQYGGLLSNLSVLENLLVPYDFHFPEISLGEKKGKISGFMALFGLSEKILNERPAKLTISARKALLFIRTYLTEPKIIFYDDPFINCNLQIKKTILQLILKLKEKQIIQIFCESIDEQLYELADKVILLQQGKLYSSNTFKEFKKSNSEFVTGLISKLLAE